MRQVLCEFPGWVQKCPQCGRVREHANGYACGGTFPDRQHPATEWEWVRG